MNVLSKSQHRVPSRSPHPQPLVISHSCPHCGAEVEYHDGFVCSPCGLDFGDGSDPAELEDGWREAGARMFPAATLLNPIHLMIYNGDRRDDPWILHLGGCPRYRWSGEPGCRFQRRIEDLSDVLRASRFMVTGDGEADDFGGETPQIVDATYAGRPQDVLAHNGLYLVDAAGPSHRPLRVISLLARANKHGVVDPYTVEIEYPPGSRHGILVRRRRAEEAAQRRADHARHEAWRAAREAARENVPDGPPSRMRTVELPPFTETTGEPS